MNILLWVLQVISAILYGSSGVNPASRNPIVRFQRA